MNKNTTIPVGAIVMINQIENRYGLFKHLFNDVGLKAKEFIPNVKVLVGNKLTNSVSILQMPEKYSQEFAKRLGMKELMKDRTLNKTLERIRNVFHLFSGDIISSLHVIIWLTSDKLLISHQVILKE